MSYRDPVLDVLRDAQALVRTGWARNDRMENDLQHSPLSAVLAVAHHNLLDALPAAGWLTEALSDLHGVRYVDDWNSAEGRTLPQVMQLFDVAIMLAEGGNAGAVSDAGGPTPSHPSLALQAA